jgi:hypothetical protein
MDLTLVLGILKEGLTLWNNVEASKYLDKVINLEKKYNEELAKPEDERSDLAIDNCLLQLRIIAQSFVKYPGKKS